MAGYKPRMDKVVVKRYLRDGGDDRKYYLSLLSLKDFSISEIFRLPFYSDHAQVDGYNCHDWLCFENCRSKFVVYNITTKQVKFLPPPKLDNPSYRTLENGSGIGYDSISDDYKVVRNFTVCYPDGHPVDRTELYSIKNDSLKEIPSPKKCVVCPSGGRIYVGGSFYWVACIGNFIRVLCFDFAKETYSTIPLPPDIYRKDPLHYLVECEGFLGIITFPKINYGDFFTRPRVPMSCARPQVSSKSSKRRRRRCFELWVWKDRSWTKLYDAALHHVRKPLCLIDGRVSLFQGRTRRKQCDLVIYDWTTKEMKRLDICDYPGHMQVFCNLDSGVELLPDAKPMNGPCKSKIKTKAKPIDTIGEGNTPHFIVTGECKFDRGLEGGSLEEIPAKRRRRKKACMAEDISDGGLEE